jgi:ectoine hydroxylase
MKEAFEGDVWRWHQDFTFWHFNDGLRESRAVTAMVFLNPVTEFNAPILLIPGTQDEPLLPCRGFSKDSQVPPGSPEWHENVVANFKYTTTDDEIRRLAAKNGIISAKGDAGTVLFFHSSMLHASTWNISPWPRTSILITYNAASNRPSTAAARRDGQRPAFLVATRTDPLTPLDGLALQP